MAFIKIYANHFTIFTTSVVRCIQSTFDRGKRKQDRTKSNESASNDYSVYRTEHRILYIEYQ